MILVAELVTTARSYLRAARLLNRKSGDSPDASVYLCGYAVEIALKSCICRTLGWAGYPSDRREFEGYTSFQTHNLGRLLHLSGVEARVTTDPAILAEWSVVLQWNPEQRYDPLGSKTKADALNMTEATGKVLKVL